MRLRSVLLTACLIAVLFVLAAPATMAAALDINFDGIPTPNNQGGVLWGTVPADCGVPGSGFVCTGLEVVNQPSFQAYYGTDLTFPSSLNAAYNGSGVLEVSVSDDPFDLVSAYFSHWPNVDGSASLTVTITGYLNNVQVGSPVVVHLADGFVSVPVGLNNIDRATFTADGANRWWLMDNLTVSSAVPEPATLFLAIGGVLVGLGLFRRRHPRT
jgi:hypothetical protein